MEDEAKMAAIIARGLRAEGFSVSLAESERAGLALARADHGDLIILDLQLPDASGTHLLRELHQQRRNVPVLVMTARGELKTKA